MKKQFYSILTAAIAGVAALFTLASCHDDIYGLINSEVKLEKNGLNGDINSIVRYKNYLVLANGKIYYKTAQPSAVTRKENGQWSRTTSPTSERGDNDVPATTFFLAADSEYLYALSYIWEEDEDGDNTPERAELYATDSDPASGGLLWKRIDITAAGTDFSFGNVKIIFDNQATEETDRAAYARIRANRSGDYRLYKLKGPSDIEPAVGSFISGSEKDAVSACRLGGRDYFSNCYSMSTNGTYIYYTKSHTSSNHVNGDSSLFYSTDSGNEIPSDIDKGSILSLAVAGQYILLGTTNGLARVNLDAEGKPSDTSKLPANGNSIISEYVFKVFVLNPSLDEGETDEYAASAIHGSIRSSSDAWEDTGLYAYYPTRREWNRDGD